MKRLSAASGRKVMGVRIPSHQAKETVKHRLNFLELVSQLDWMINVGPSQLI